MNQSKLMLFLGGIALALGAAGFIYVWRVNGQAWSYYGPAACFVSGIGLLHARHHKL